MLVFTGNSTAPKKDGLEKLGVKINRDAANGRDLALVLDELGSRNITSLLVEGGANVAGKFLDAGLVNKISVFVAPTIIGGRDAPSAIGGQGAETLAEAFDLQDVEITTRGRDVEFTGYPRRRDEG